MAALVAHVFNKGVGASGPSNPSTDIDTTGANLLVAVVDWYAPTNDAPSPPTDSKSNSGWALKVNREGSSGGGFAGGGTAIFHCENPTVGANHNFTVSPGYGSISVFAFSGAFPSPAYDQSNFNDTLLAGGPGGATTLKPGAITPTTDGQIIVTGFAEYNSGGGGPSVDSGFTIPTGHSVGPSPAVNVGHGAAYKIQSTAALIDPTWTAAGTTESSAVIASWKTTVLSTGVGAAAGIGAATGVSSSYMSMRPTSDIATNSWQSSLGGALYAAVDEPYRDDADYIYSPEFPTTQQFEVKLASAPDPAVSSGHVITLRLQALGYNTNFDMNLVQGSTILDSWTENVTVAAGLVTRTRTLSGGVADSITDYSNLRIRGVARA